MISVDSFAPQKRISKQWGVIEICLGESFLSHYRKKKKRKDWGFQSSQHQRISSPPLDLQQIAWIINCKPTGLLFFPRKPFLLVSLFSLPSWAILYALSHINETLYEPYLWNFTGSKDSSNLWSHRTDKWQDPSSSDSSSQAISTA